MMASTAVMLVGVLDDPTRSMTMSRESYVHSLRQAIAFADIAAEVKPTQGYPDDRHWWRTRAKDLRSTLNGRSEA